MGISIAKDAEVIELDKQVELDHSFLKGKDVKKKIDQRNKLNKDLFNKKRELIDYANSHASENIIKHNYT